MTLVAAVVAAVVAAAVAGLVAAVGAVGPAAPGLEGQKRHLPADRTDPHHPAVMGCDY